jgi:ATP-dependent RNA helicase RhlE
LPLERQNLLFSATISDDVRTLSKRTFSNATEISIGNNSASKPKIDQWLITVDKGNKSALLSHLIIEHQWQQALIFIETKHGAAKLVSQLEKRGISAESIHGGRTQAMREQVLNDFKVGEIKFLVATGIASRGLDIGELTRVVNYDLPDQVDDYIHRIGRTGRAGASGEAVSFVAKDNFRNLCAIESRLGHVIKRKEFEGFPVKKVVPLSILNYVPKNKR